MKILITENQLKRISEMSISAYHGTPHNFDEFDIRKVGSGESSQWFGWGLYFTDSEDIADWYSTSIAQSKNQDISSKGTLMINGISYDFNGFVSFICSTPHPISYMYKALRNTYDGFIEYVKGNKKWEEVRFTEQNKTNIINEIINIFESWILQEEERIKDMENLVGFDQIKSHLELSKRILQGLKDNKNPIIDGLNSLINFEPSYLSLHTNTPLHNKTYTYNVTLHKGKTPNEYDYMSWYDEITPEQKKKIVNQIKTEKLKNRVFYIVRPEDEETEIQPRFFHDATSAKEYTQRAARNILGLGITIHKHVMEKRTFNLQENLNGTVKDFYIQLCGLLGGAKEASMFLLRSGIDGIKYPSNSLTGKQSKGTNFVVFDPKSVSIEKKKETMTMY